ncbi:MAG: response regulator [Kofleriaceae bacterium]|nr:response regulator [Kofleriaceae bacterium]
MTANGTASVGDELVASESRLRAILGCTKGIVFEFDRDARYLNLWTHEESLLARPRSEVIGRTIVEALGEEVGRPLAECVRRVYDTGISETLEYELVLRGGRRWFLADILITPPTGGRERTVAALVRDMTAHKQLEEQLRQAQKMEAIGQLVGGIAHDFNNILTTIVGYSELLVEGLEKGTGMRRHALRIRQAAERASGLTKQLLAYGRKELLVPEILDVNIVISSMADMLRRLIGEHIELRLELDPQLGGAKFDRAKLEQVIMNLALNARDALGAGGRLTFRTDSVELDEAFCTQRVECSPGSYVLITATDTGKGMDAATKTRIFDPFFTTKEVGRGTGLGLSMVHGIVKQSGGHIEVDSEPGRGASFRVYLPRVITPPAVAAAADLRPPDATTNGHTVVIVEDDVDVRQLLDSHLRSAGYNVVVADDPDAALQLARTLPIDVLVTDVVMPKMGGDELALRMRELQPNVRVLYISGYPEDPRVAHVPRVPRSVFLPKPFTRQALVQEVNALVEMRS